MLGCSELLLESSGWLPGLQESSLTVVIVVIIRELLGSLQDIRSGCLGALSGCYCSVLLDSCKVCWVVTRVARVFWVVTW